MEELRRTLMHQGQFPSRRTWERLMEKLPAMLEVYFSQTGDAYTPGFDLVRSKRIPSAVPFPSLTG